MEEDAGSDGDNSTITRYLTNIGRIERIFALPRSPMALLQVNNESRSLALARKFESIDSIRPTAEFDINQMVLHMHVYTGKVHRNCNVNTFRAVPARNRGYICADPEMDVFVLEDGVYKEDRVVSTLKIVTRWIGPVCLDNLKRLAIYYSSWRKSTAALGQSGVESGEKWDLFNSLAEFRSLEELYIILLDNEAARPTADWSSLVRGVETHYEDMERQVSQ